MPLSGCSSNGSMILTPCPYAPIRLFFQRLDADDSKSLTIHEFEAALCVRPTPLSRTPHTPTSPAARSSGKRSQSPVYGATLVKTPWRANSRNAGIDGAKGARRKPASGSVNRSVRRSDQSRSPALSPGLSGVQEASDVSNTSASSEGCGVSASEAAGLSAAGLSAADLSATGLSAAGLSAAGLSAADLLPTPAGYQTFGPRASCYAVVSVTFGPRASCYAVVSVAKGHRQSTVRNHTFCGMR